MIKLFFGNTPTIISTGLIIVFVLFFKGTISKDPNITNWGTLALRMLLLGFMMSAMAGAKDYSGSMPIVINFGPGYKAFIILSILGVVTILLVILGFIVKTQTFYRTVFYGLSIIIITKTAIVEIMRIVKYFAE